jgi:hypothetical protein
MGSRRVRLIIFALLILAGLASGALTWDRQRRIADLARAEQESAARVDGMIATIDDISLAQQAYVAPGQPDDQWFTRVSALVQQLSNNIATTAARARSAETRGILQSASEAVSGFVTLDAGVRENLRLGEELIAADRIFGDGHKSLEAIAMPLRGVRDAERAAFDSARAELFRQTWTALGAAAGLWLIGLALLVRVPVPLALSQPTAEHAVREPLIDTPAPVPPAVPSRTPVDLGAAADVCVAISRITTSNELPDLLARAATVLDASGLTIWISEGEELFAVAAHGYDARVIARLGAIRKNADNATAAAWRKGEVTIVPGDMISDGAVVAPLFGPDGCVGVLAAEIRRGREGDSDTRAVTAMIAAQLATIVAGWPPASTAPDAIPPATAVSGS